MCVRARLQVRACACVCGLSSGIIAFKRENGHISWCGGDERALWGYLFIHSLLIRLHLIELIGRGFGAESLISRKSTLGYLVFIFKSLFFIPFGHFVL